jgi:hypothetical protein
LAVFAARAASRRVPKTIRTSAVVILLCLGIVQGRTYARFARSQIKRIAIQNTIEYKIAHWLDGALPGQRVFATGSVQFWLNAFADNPQVGGGYAQGISDFEISVIHFGVPYTQHDGSRTAMWLELLGARAVVVSGLAGRDVYHWGWHDPDKFRGVLPELWRDGDDVIYGVPARSGSLAYVIPSQAVVTRAPVNVADVEPLQALAAAVRDPSLPVPQLTWKSSGEAEIQSVAAPQQDLFVQVTYHPGWKAFVAGRRVPIRPDGLGLMVIDPHCAGACPIDLIYDGGTEMLAAKVASAAALLFMVIWCANSLRPKFR